MRKIIITLGILGSLLFLVSCKKPDVEPTLDFDDRISVQSDEFIGNTHSFIFTLENSVTNQTDIDELTNNTIYVIYNYYRSEISNKKRYFKLTFKVTSKDDLVQMYVVNQSLESPGLKKLS